MRVKKLLAVIFAAALGLSCLTAVALEAPEAEEFPAAVEVAEETAPLAELPEEPTEEPVEEDASDLVVYSLLTVTEDGETVETVHVTADMIADGAYPAPEDAQLCTYSAETSTHTCLVVYDKVTTTYKNKSSSVCEKTVKQSGTCIMADCPTPNRLYSIQDTYEVSHSFGPDKYLGSNHSAAKPNLHTRSYSHTCTKCKGTYNFTQKAGCTDAGCTADPKAAEPEPT